METAVKTRRGSAWTILCIYFLVAFFSSLYASPFWHIGRYAMFFFNTIGGLWVMSRNNSFNVKILVVTIITMLLCTRGNMFAFIGAFMTIMPFLAFLSLKKEKQIEVFEFLKKSMAVIVGVSLVGWVLYLFGVKLPYFIDYYGSAEFFDDNSYIFHNHILYLVNLQARSADAWMGYSTMRYSAVFLEPGYFSSILAILLYSEHYNLKKWQNKVFLVAIILSFSLAGWLLTAFGFAWRSLQKSKIRVLSIMGVFILLGGIIVFAELYNGGDNVINYRILQRMEYDQETGTITGDNRSNASFVDWFANVFSKNPLYLLFGGYSEFQDLVFSSGTGWRLFLLKYGLVGLIAYVVFLNVQLREARKTHLKIGLLLIYLFFLYQDDGYFLSVAFLIVYYSSLMCLDDDYKRPPIRV